MSATQTLRDMGQAARQAGTELARQSGRMRAQAIRAMAEALRECESELMAANRADLEAARLDGMAAPLLKRLEVSDSVFRSMQAKLTATAGLADPVGTVIEGHTNPDGLQVKKVRVPLGVVGIIYESRPNVTTDAAAVCIKSGNAVILRGGSEALRTNQVLADAMISGADRMGLPAGSIHIVRTADRAAVGEMLALEDCIDVIIPRGGRSLIQRIARESRIPVIKHYDGVCHLYVAADAAAQMAVDLALNSKCQRVEVCNALETLLVDAACAPRLLPHLAEAFVRAGVTCRGCDRCREIVPDLDPAAEEDWHTEYLAPVIAIRIVKGVDEATRHVNTYGSGHTDGIVTQSLTLAERFTASVDSASVLVNASTRLSGGGAYGLGAVVGISTDKLHARGPVGPGDLTTTKWIAVGNGHLRM